MEKQYKEQNQKSIVASVMDYCFSFLGYGNKNDKKEEEKEDPN